MIYDIKRIEKSPIAELKTMVDTKGTDLWETVSTMTVSHKCSCSLFHGDCFLIDKETPFWVFRRNTLTWSKRYLRKLVFCFFGTHFHLICIKCTHFPKNARKCAHFHLICIRCAHFPENARKWRAFSWKCKKMHAFSWKCKKMRAFSWKCNKMRAFSWKCKKMQENARIFMKMH